MDDISTFLNELSNNYPKLWWEIDKYVVYLLPIENKDPLEFKSIYTKTHICIITKEGAKYIPKEIAVESEISKTLDVFNIEMIDYKSVFENFDENYFDIEEWCDKREKLAINEIKEFLFTCNIFKGIVFLDNLNSTIDIIEDNLNNLWKIIEPNWLQIEITNELIRGLKYLKEETIHFFSLITPEISKKKDQLSDNNSKQRDVEKPIWYKIAQLLAIGDVEITSSKYTVYGEDLITDESAAKRISENGIGIKWKSIKPYLNTTKSGTISDKNIFYKSRIEKLKLIGIEASNKGTLNILFQQRLEQLILTNN